MLGGFALDPVNLPQEEWPWCDHCGRLVDITSYVEYQPFVLKFYSPECVRKAAPKIRWDALKRCDLSGALSDTSHVEMYQVVEVEPNKWACPDCIRGLY